MRAFSVIQLATVLAPHDEHHRDRYEEPKIRKRASTIASPLVIRQFYCAAIQVLSLHRRTCCLLILERAIERANIGMRERDLILVVVHLDDLSAAYLELFGVTVQSAGEEREAIASFHRQFVGHGPIIARAPPESKKIRESHDVSQRASRKMHVESRAISKSPRHPVEDAFDANHKWLF